MGRGAGNVRLSLLELNRFSSYPSITEQMSNIAEVAVPYAILALTDDNVDVTVENVQKILSAANIDVDAIWISIFVRAFEGKNINDMLSSFSSGPAAAVAAAPAAASAAAAAPAAKVEEKKEESDEEMGFGLFD